MLMNKNSINANEKKPAPAIHTYSISAVAHQATLPISHSAQH